MSSNSAVHEEPAESCTKPADKQCTNDAEQSNNNPTRNLSGNADQVDMNVTDHQPQVNRTGQVDEQGPDVRNGETRMQTHAPSENNMQAQSKPGTSSSLPKKNGLVNGSGKRSNGKANKLAKAVNQPASGPPHLSSLQTPPTPLMSSLFPASFAPPAIFTPSNENGHGQMSYNNQSLHKIQKQDPSLTHVSTRMVCATESPRENPQTSAKALAKSHKNVKRRKQAVESHDRAADMETLTESSTLLPQFYYPTGNALFPQLDSCNVQNLQGYSNYSVFPQRLNDYSWMVHQNAAFHSSNMNSALEMANLAHIKAFSVPAQQKSPSDSYFGKQKHEDSTNGDHKEHKKRTQENEEIKCTTVIKSESCFPVTKSNIGSPARTTFLHSPQLNSSSEFTLGQSRISPPRRAFNDKRENDDTDSDVRGIAPKKKRLSGGENASVLWATSPHSSAAQHAFHPPITSSPHSHKPASESPAPILSLPSPLTPRGTPVAPSSSETALTPEQTLDSQQFPFVPTQPNVSTTGQVVTREKDVFYCHMCSYFDKSKTKFEAHMSTHFECICPHCDYTARTEGRLNRHIKDFHSENNFKRHFSDRSKTYKCKQCTFTSTEREKFWEHSRTHIKEGKLLQCNHCSFVTEYKHHLEYHISNHFGSKPFKCDKCNYSCVNRSMLNSHKKSHTKIYPHRCSDCTYATKYAHSLKLHLKKFKHKPAMTLNHDGSLPEKADGEHSGSHSGAKSYCTTDQSGLRNDAVNQYFSQLGMSSSPLGMPSAPLGMPSASLGMPSAPLGMPSAPLGMPSAPLGMPSAPLGMPSAPLGMPSAPLGMPSAPLGMPSAPLGMPSAPLGMPVMAPAFNNMMPFWPMLHPSSMQSSMLTGMMMFNQLMGIGDVNKDDSEIEGESKHAAKNEQRETNRRMDVNNLVCQICSLAFQSTEAWYHHMSYVHGNTAKEAVEYNYSNEEVPRNRYNSKGNCNQDWKDHQLVHPFTASDDQQDKVHQNNSSSHILPGVNSDHVNNERVQKAESANILPESSHLPLYSDKSSCKRKLEDLHQNVTISNNKNENINDPANRPDTLQQNTKNSKPETSSQKKILPGEQTLQEDARNTQNTVTDFKNNLHFQCSPSALDVSHQKPSTVFSNPDFPMEKDKENITSNKEHSGNQVTSPSKASTLLPSKHILSEGENIVINSEISDEITIPRKRSRKGKAYRLDISSLQQQKIPTDLFYDEDELEFVTGIAFDQDRPLKFTDKDKTVDETHLTEVQWCKPKVASDQQAVTGENNAGLYDAESKYLGTRNLHKMVPEDCKKRKTEFSQNKNINTEEIEIKVNSNTKSDVEAIENSENGQIILHETEIEIKKLQNEQVESYSKKLKTCQEDTEGVNISENTNGKLCFGSHAKENVTEVSTSNGMVSEHVVMTAQSQKIKDELNQTEMRNSVNEEKDETASSLVKRTNLVWSMMKLGMIPMSSELPHVRSLSQKQTGMSSPVLQGTLPDLSVRGYDSSGIHNDIKSSDVLPSLSQPHYFNSSFNPHVENSAPLAKPPANLVSSPPKAYVHPTNRKTPDPRVAPPASVNKQRERKLYKCTHCELSFGDCIMYTVHMGYHSKQNAFECNNCGVVCQDRIEFFLHMVQSSHP